MTVPLIRLPQAELPLHGSFSGHETFCFRYAWLKKGVDGLRADSDIFTTDEALVTLGVGKNMVKSVRHWCLATQVIEDQITPQGRARGLNVSPLGESLFEDPAWDPYLEDDSTLWLLHWLLATNMRRATTWYWAFNLMKEQDFTRETLSKGLVKLAEGHNWTRMSDTSLKADVSCFVRTYVAGKRGATSTLEDTIDCPLTNLSLIAEVDDDRFRFNNGPKPSLSDAIFVYALLDFMEERHAGQDTVSLREIVHGIGSPGRVFRLDDEAVLDYLDRIQEITGGRLRFQDTVDLRQIQLVREITKRDILNDYYRS